MKKKHGIDGNLIEFKYSELSEFGKKALTTSYKSRNNKRFTLSEEMLKKAESKRKDLIEKLNSI